MSPLDGSLSVAVLQSPMMVQVRPQAEQIPRWGASLVCRSISEERLLGLSRELQAEMHWASSIPGHSQFQSTCHSQVMSKQEAGGFQSCPEPPPHLGLLHRSHLKDRLLPRNILWYSIFLQYVTCTVSMFPCLLSVPALVPRTLTVAGMWWWRSARAWRRVWAWLSGSRASPPVRYVPGPSNFQK